MDAIGPGTLKIIVATDGAIADAIEHNLRTIAPDVLRLNETSWLAFGEAEPSAIRDALSAKHPDAHLIVAEFEPWSSHGASIDSEWLLRRGH